MTKMNSEAENLEKKIDSLDIDNGILSRLRLLMNNDISSEEPSTPPEPEHFFDDSQATKTVDENRLDYYKLALKEWPDGNPFDRRPPSPVEFSPKFLLGPPIQSSSSSRDPSPTTFQTEEIEAKKIKRRYVPHSQNRKFRGKSLVDEFSKSVEDFRITDFLGQQRGSQFSESHYRSGQCSPTSQTTTSPLTTFSTKTHQGSVVRKLSIRRLQRPKLRMAFDDQESHSSDEMSNLRLNGTLKSSRSSGSLPIIVANNYSINEQSDWQKNVSPSNSSPLLNKNSMITSTIDNGSMSDFQVLRVPALGSGDISSEQSVCSEKGSLVSDGPHSAPPLNNSESLFVFERRKSLIQELPAITEDQLDEKNDTWHSANDNQVEENDGFLHKRSTSDYTMDKSSPSLERHRSEKLNRPLKSEMRIISGNPNLSDNEDLKSKFQQKDKSHTLNGSIPLSYSTDFSDSFCRQKTSSLVLQQDGSKTLQLVETKSDYSEFKKQCPDDRIEVIPNDLPDQGSRKARILKRKSKIKRHKSSLRKAPISSAVDHISPMLIQNADIEAEKLQHSTSTANIVMRKTSDLTALTRKRNGSDKKKEKKIFSLFGSTRIKERKDSRSIFHQDQNGPAPIDRKRFSLVDMGSWSNRNLTEGLPDVLARVLSSTSEFDLKNGTLSGYNDDDNTWPQLQKNKWKDLELWSEDPSSWSERFPDIKLSAGEEKRQNIIYEFYSTEKRHCQVVVFMQQIFQVGLLQHNILTVNEIKALIPDVIDSLLDFHLNLLRRIRQRIFTDPIVSTISDIVYDEFKNGENRTSAIKAYTDFCLARDSSDFCYNEYMSKNLNFKLFCENLEKFPIFKKRNFKSCFLLIIQRLTKYPSLIEQIIKYESIPEVKVQGQRALTAVRNFALRVDRELSCQLLNRRFDQVRLMIDKNSVGRVLGQKFTFDDLVLGKDEFRKILSIGTVRWESATHQSFELTMLLFDDIIVFLQNKNNSLHFFTHKDHSSILPLHTTLIREIPRSNMIMLIVVAQQTPDMYQLSFQNRNEMEQWVAALNTAQKSAPKYVRLTQRKLFVKGNSKNNTENEEESEEEKYIALLTKWQDQLDSIFLTQMNNEPKLLQYMEERMNFLDQVRKHLSDFPSRPQLENNGIIPSSVKSRDARELTKMKTILNSHFMDLRSFRRNQLDKLVEYAQRSRDSDLTSFFDDLHELGHPNNADSVGFSNSSSDENQPSTSDRSCRPRRVRTWNIGNIEAHQNDIIRRHTTVPKVSASQQQIGSSTNEHFDSCQIDERIRKLSLNADSKSRRAATEMVRENISLRVENDRLRSENVLQGIHLAALRNRKSTPETTEKLESLRQKQEEVQARSQEFKKEYEKRLNELKRREQELEEKETELKERERQCGKENFSCELADLDSINSSGISRDTSFRSGAVIFNSSPTIPIPTSRSNTDIVPKHLAETKEKRGKK